jgi:Co/Zn/Cd efflux system component
MGNVGVLLVAVGVNPTGSARPDIVIGLLVVGVFCRLAILVLRDVRQERQLSN